MHRSATRSKNEGEEIPQQIKYRVLRTMTHFSGDVLVSLGVVSCYLIMYPVLLDLSARTKNITGVFSMLPLEGDSLRVHGVGVALLWWWSDDADARHATTFLKDGKRKPKGDEQGTPA